MVSRISNCRENKENKREQEPMPILGQIATQVGCLGAWADSCPIGLDQSMTVPKAKTACSSRFFCIYYLPGPQESLKIQGEGDKRSFLGGYFAHLLSSRDQQTGHSSLNSFGQRSISPSCANNQDTLLLEILGQLPKLLQIDLVLNQSR